MPTATIEQPRERVTDVMLEQEIHKLLEAVTKGRLSVGGFGEKFKKNRFLHALFIATGLHVPLLHGDKLIAYAKAGISQLENWDGRILHPQSKEEQAKVDSRVAERRKATDGKKVDAFKDEVRKKLESGEAVSFRDMYFHLEELNGVPQAEVAAARKKADERIDEYRKKFVGGFEEAELRAFVDQMYGPDSNSELGQASVTVYFNTGKRNCNAIAKGELIVLDGVLEHMPEDVRKRYQLGNQYVSQHVYATLSTVRRDGKIEKTFLLEQGIRTVEKELGQAGTATVSLDLLKQSMVTDSPTVIDAQKGAGILKGPILDLKTDQPVQDNVVVNGALRPSDFVMQHIGEKRSEEKNVQPVPQEALHEPDVMELTLEVPMSVEKAKELVRTTDWEHSRGINLEKEILSPETVRVFNTAPRVHYGRVSRFSKETIEEMLMSKHANSFTIDTEDKTGLLPPQFFEAVTSARARGALHHGMLIIDSSKESAGVSPLPVEQLKKLFSGPPIAKTIYIPSLIPTSDMASLIAKSEYEQVLISRWLYMPEDLRAILRSFEKSKPKILFQGYASLLQSQPRLIQFSSIESDMGITSGTIDEISKLEKLKTAWMKDPVNKKWVPFLDKRLIEWKTKFKVTESELKPSRRFSD